jgi:phosphatidate cytidylyltransferase
MALHLPTFFTRLGSAIVFSAVMMAGLLWKDWAFVILVLIIHDLCLREYFRLMGKIFPEVATPDWLKYGIRTVGNLLVLLIMPGTEAAQYWPAVLAIPTLLLLLTTLSKQTLLRSALQAFGALIYITLPLVLLIMLRSISIVIPLALVLMIWMNDTMAYLVGSFIGKTPFSKISPKKTWEGTAGGAILTIVGAAVWGYYSPWYSMADWMVMALCASVAGTAGDLLESKLKRMADVKDSGTMMPGHGGALDRFDSLLVATPFVFAYAWCLMEATPGLAIF